MGQRKQSTIMNIPNSAFRDEPGNNIGGSGQGNHQKSTCNFDQALGQRRES